MIENNDKAAALWIENQGLDAKMMQLRVYAWTQQNGKDELLEQQELIGSPPMMVIEPGKRQMLRLINSMPVPPGKELTYRVLVDEIPLDDNEISGVGVNFRLRFSIPIFIYGNGMQSRVKDREQALLDTSANDLSWKIIQEDGKDWLEINNQGARHVHLSHIHFQGDEKHNTGNGPFSGYVLSGSCMRWAIPEAMPRATPLMTLINQDQTRQIIPATK